VNKQFTLDFTRAAEKDLRTLGHREEEILLCLAELPNNPVAGHSLVGSLRGCRALDFNLKGSGAYRALYIVDTDRQVCTVFLVGPHENIYREAERRIRALRKSGEIPDVG
jgi:mRNA-degrading endonuclease RelE of RelBE toxin-antitoxin system